MNDLERQVRDTLQRHQDDAPVLDISEARRTGSRTRRRQARNVVVGTIGAAAVMVALAGIGGLVRADPSPTVIAPASPSPTCEATPGPGDAETEVHGWPSTTRNQAGVYSWDAQQQGPSSIEGFMHNAYSPGSGLVNILFEGVPGQLDPHRGETAATVAGCEATYRRFIRKGGRSALFRGPAEEWMVDIQGTTVTITIVAERGAPAAELAEAHAIVDSIRREPQDNDLGFRLDFTLKTNTWDSG